MPAIGAARHPRGERLAGDKLVGAALGGVRPAVDASASGDVTNFDELLAAESEPVLLGWRLRNVGDRIVLRTEGVPRDCDAPIDGTPEKVSTLGHRFHRFLGCYNIALASAERRLVRAEARMGWRRAEPRSTRPRLPSRACSRRSRGSLRRPHPRRSSDAGRTPAREVIGSSARAAFGASGPTRGETSTVNARSGTARMRRRRSSAVSGAA